MGMEEDATGLYKGLIGSGNVYLQAFNKFVSFLAGAAKAALETRQKILESKGQATEFAVSLANIDFKHASFGSQWSLKFQQQELKNVEMKFKGEELKLRGKELDIQIESAKIQVEQAKIGIDQADLAVKQAAFAMDQAMLNIKQAEIGVQQAIFGLRAAEIAAARADIDYAKKVKELEKNLLAAQKAAIESEKNYKDELAKLYEPWIKLDDAASKYVKTLGGSAALMRDLKRETLSYVTDNKLESKYNISAEELVQTQMKYNQELGRSTRLTGEQMENLAAMRAVFGDEKTVKLATALDHFGYDFNRSASLAGKLFADASKHGISLEKASKYFLDNVKMAQTYTFENGLKGLAKMAEQAAKINFNMAETGKAAEKMGSVEGAMETAANLSVLGGSFTMFSNPLAMLNESLTDMASLQDRIINMFGKSAHWDSGKGEISVDAEQKRLIKEASSSMGMDYNNVMDSVYSAGRINQLNPQLDKLNISEDLKELLRNTAQLNEKGQGYVNIDGKETTLDKAAQMDPEELAKILKQQTQSDSDNIKDIAQNLRSVKDNVEAWGKSYGDNIAKTLEENGMGQEFRDNIQQQAENSEYMKGLASSMLDVGLKSADMNKEMAQFNKYYAEETKKYELESAKLQKEQAQYGPVGAKAALRSAHLQAQMAPLQKIQARIQERTADLGQRTAKNSEKSANLAYDRAKLAKQKFNEYEKPAFELEAGEGMRMQMRELIFQYITQKQMDDIYQNTRAAAESSYYTQIATSLLAKLENNGLFSIDFWTSAMTAKKQYEQGREAQSKMEANMRDVLGLFDKSDAEVMQFMKDKQEEAQDAIESNLEEVKVQNGGGSLEYIVDDDMGGWSVGDSDDDSFSVLAKKMPDDVKISGSKIEMSAKGLKVYNYLRQEKGWKPKDIGSHGGLDTIVSDAEKWAQTDDDWLDYDSRVGGGDAGGADNVWPRGTSSISSTDVIPTVAGGKYSTTMRSTSNGKRVIGGSIDLTLSSITDKEHLETIVQSIMNSPVLIQKFSKYIMQEISDMNNFGYLKDAGSSFSSHIY